MTESRDRQSHRAFVLEDFCLGNPCTHIHVQEEMHETGDAKLKDVRVMNNDDFEEFGEIV